MHYTFATYRAALRRIRRTGTLAQRIGADLVILMGIERVTFVAAWIGAQIDALDLTARRQFSRDL